MWRLKYEYIHDDCKYTPLTKKLDVAVLTFPLNNFMKKGLLHLTAIHVLIGNQRNVKKYISYLKKISIKYELINNNIIFTLITIERNTIYYKSFYNPTIIYPTPMMHKTGKEYVEIASWDRSVLANILKELEKNKNTKFLKVLSFKHEKLKDVFLLKTIPKITKKQRKVFEFVVQEGYYNYPRKKNLDEISKMMNLSKSNLHEILRRAESNIFNYC